jgi:ribosomal protein L29
VLFQDEVDSLKQQLAQLRAEADAASSGQTSKDKQVKGESSG